jgi:NADH-quinone oxidoreductase subunit J
MQELVFYSFAFFIVLSALLVISIKNPVHAVLFLIFAFFNASGLFILLGAEYIALTLVIVYVGAVAVLFLFVIMMLDVDFATLKQGFFKSMPLALLLGATILAEILFAIYNGNNFLPYARRDVITLNNTQAIGMKLYTDYFLPFQASGIILLVAMIGAIVLTIRHAKRIRRQDIYKQVTRKREDCVELVKVKSGKGVDI